MPSKSNLRKKRKHRIEDRIRKKLSKKKHCFYCGRKLDTTNKSIDHKNPINNGGRGNKYNLVASCKKCNGYKGDMDFREWMQVVYDAKINYDPDPDIKGFKIGPEGSYIQK